MNRFVDVPRADFEALMTRSGFVAGRAGNEITWERRHAVDSRLSVVVYSSIAYNAAEARGCGEDAIRVVGLFQWTHRPTGEARRKHLFSAKVLRVNSVEGVLARTLEKMREAYAACNAFAKKDPKRQPSRLPSDYDPRDPQYDRNINRYGEGE